MIKTLYKACVQQCGNIQCSLKIEATIKMHAHNTFSQDLVNIILAFENIFLNKMDMKDDVAFFFMHD